MQTQTRTIPMIPFFVFIASLPSRVVVLCYRTLSQFRNVLKYIDGFRQAYAAVFVDIAICCDLRLHPGDDLAGRYRIAKRNLKIAGDISRRDRIDCEEF